MAHPAEEPRNLSERAASPETAPKKIRRINTLELIRNVSFHMPKRFVSFVG